ncbi:MAG: hypothetical protein IJL74_03580 [Bacilli bacterium]|nr:hypothetical protein [Bacilli bacterium]
MKKIFIFALILCICLVGCGKKSSSSESEIVGGWTANNDIKAVNIPEDASKALNKATESYDGMTFEPVALLGKQVVSGTNYMFLCKGTTVTEKPVTSLKMVVVYNDLKGNASVSSVKDFDYTKYVSKDIEVNTEQLSGAWSVNSNIKATTLSDDVNEAFTKATSIVGVEYTPIVYLGKQVVSGTNYAFLALAKTVTAESVYSIDVLTIYDSLDEDAKLSSVAYVDLADFNS